MIRFSRKGVSTPRVVLRGDEKARERVVARARAKPSPALLLLSRKKKKKKKKKKRERKTNTIKKEKFKIPNFSHSSFKRVPKCLSSLYLLKLCAFGSSFARAIDAALFFSASSFSAGLL